MKFDIRNRYTGNVQFTAEIECAEDASESVKRGLAVRWAVANKTNLSEANLSGAYLRGANLSKANLSGAYLRGADLSEVDLNKANLSGAYLSEVDLSEANLSGAYLRGADLSEVDLSEVDLSRANLRGANLSKANLSGAYLSEVDLSEANLRGADLSGAIGIISFGPIGQKHRIGYAAKHDVGPMIRLGCFWGTLDEACAAIRAKYGENSTYENLVRASCAALD